MNNSPTIVAASLDDEKLKKSIEQMVQNLNDGLNRMKESTDAAVSYMQKSLHQLGNTKIDSGGTADGGSSRRTKSLSEESLKAKEVTMSYDQMQSVLQRIAKDNSGLKDIRTFNGEELQSYIDLLRKLQAEYVRVNTQEGGGAKSDEVKRDMAELEKIIQGYQAILRNVEAINSRQGTIDVKKWTQDIGAVDDRYKKLVRWYTVLEKEDQRRIANEEKANQKRLAELSKEEAARQKMIESARKAEEKYQNAVLKTAFDNVINLPSNNIDQMRTKLERLKTILANIRELGVLSPKDISNAETEIGKLRGNIQQIEKIEKERIEAEKRFVIEQAKEIEQTQTLEGRIKSLAQIARERLKESQQSFTDLQAYGKAFRVFDASSSFAKGLSIEEQIKNALTEEKTAREGVSQSAQQQANSTQNVAKANQEESAAIQKNFRDYDSLRQAIASVLGIKSENVRLQGAEISSINVLSDRLKQLRAVYNQLGTDDRHSETGKALIAQIQNVERQMDRARKELSRPIDLKSAFGLSEKTLDDMAYKLRQLQAYKQGIDLTKPNADAEIKKVDSAIKQLKTDMDKYMSTGREVNSMNNALARSFNYMKNRLAFYFTVGASTQFVKNLINIRGQYELLERSIGILFDSMQTGTKIFSELNAMAIKSPFTTMELGAAAKQLSAYNIAAKDVVDTTRRLADIAAAVGVPIERLTYALGQIKSYGYLNSRDARMFANAGIPLIQNLADMYTKLEGRLVSIGDVYDRIKHKQVSFEDTLKVVNEMTDEGGRFFNFQEKAADTLVVRLANLTLAWNNMMNELGKDNTGMIHGMLGGLKTLFEHWRDIDAAIWGVVKILGVVKTAQFIWLMYVRKTGIELALANTFGQKLGYTLLGIGVSMKTLAVNPMTWIAAAVVSLGYLYQKWRDLQEANENFNKSIADGAKENIESIDKFFGKYRKEIESIGSSQSTDQEKMWERIRDEIEKTTKNAQQYIDILEKIPDAAERVGKASLFLEQQQTIQQEARRMAEHGMFDMGGGFANDSLAKDLQEYEKTMNDVLKKYNSLEDAQKDFNDSMVAWSSGHYAVKYYNEAIEEAEKELDDFTSILDKANLARVMGEGSDEERLANIRSFAQLIRDNFLATEEGQKISAEGQARLNKEIDYWIAQQGVSNGLIKGQRAEVEANRSAWENFFTYLNADQKKALDYLISTGQTSSDEFKKIWNGAADEMKKSSLTAYEQIQSHIADLRKTAPIVIDVIYRETKESKDEAQKDFEKRFTTPDYVTNRSAEAYLAEQKRLNTIYGRFNKKTDEDMVEWEKRLGQEYQDNEKKLDSYNKMLEGYNKLTDEQKKKREAQINTVTKERDALQATQNALKEIQSYENFDFEQFKKGKKSGGSKKDFLGEAFAKVVEVTTNMQKRFKEYKQAGVDANTALEMSTQEYAKTLEGTNATLAKYGIRNTKTGLELAKMELRDLRAYYESLLAIASGVGNTKGVEALEKAIASLNVEITKIDYKKITDGLNNELSKLKDEYELAVELDANPELGDMFASMFGIDPSDFSHSIDDYMFKVQSAFEKARRELGYGVTIDVFKANDEEWKKWGEWVGLSGEALDNFKARFVSAQDVAKKWAQNTVKQVQDLQYKLADNNRKIAIEEEKRANLRKRLAQETNEEQKRLLNLQIQEQEQAIAKLKESLLQELSAYKKLFGGVSEHSAVMTRKLAKQYKTILDNAKKDDAGKFVITDGESQVTLSESTYYKEVKRVNDELRKSQSSIKAIKEAFTKGDDDVVDFWKGIELIADEMEKVASLANTIGDIAEYFGNPNEYNETAEALRDISQSISGVATTAKGVGQIASGDYIGGAASVVSGLWQTISSWLDNSDKKIQESIKNSERAVKRLELAYVDLQQAVDKAYGTAAIGAKQAALANKELQLAELQRQIQLEKSRESKNRDEDRILDLQKQYNELFYEIQNGYTEIVDDLMGTDVASFAENLVSSMIDAFKQGEDYMDVFNKKFDEMIDNMIMKSIVSRVVSQYLNQIWDSIDQRINDRSQEERNEYVKAQDYAKKVRGMTDEELKKEMATQRTNKWSDFLRTLATLTDKDIEEYRKAVAAEEIAAKKRLDAATEFTGSDVDYIMGQITEVMPELGQKLKDILGEYYKFGESSETQLSSLQQGLQSMSESTANALEAYANSISQQAYLRNDLLVQIRDTIMSFDMDVQLGVFSQMLLQLQNNYIVMQSMQSMMEGWTTPSGQGIRVELIS